MKLQKIMFYTCLSLILFTGGVCIPACNGGVCLWVGGVHPLDTHTHTHTGHTHTLDTHTHTHTPWTHTHTHTHARDTHTPGHTPPWADIPPRQTPSPQDSHWSGRYAYYWNAFLLYPFFLIYSFNDYNTVHFVFDGLKWKWKFYCNSYYNNSFIFPNAKKILYFLTLARIIMVTETNVHTQVK